MKPIRQNSKRKLPGARCHGHAKIGSLIEIHGDGGRGIDWTEGCISLTNAEMDVVFKIAKEGTPVTIIGSMVSLDQLLD